MTTSTTTCDCRQQVRARGAATRRSVPLVLLPVIVLSHAIHSLELPLLSVSDDEGGDEDSDVEEQDPRRTADWGAETDDDNDEFAEDAAYD